MRTNKALFIFPRWCHHRCPKLSVREIQQKYKDLYEIPDYYVKYLRGQLYEEKFSIKKPNLIANVRPFLPVCVVFVLFFSVSTRLS